MSTCVQYNPSTLKVSYYSANNTVQTIDCPECVDCIKVEFAGVTECAAPNDTWPAAFPNGPFYFIGHVSGSHIAYAEPKSLGNGWFIDLFCNSGGTQRYRARVYYDAGEEVYAIAFAASTYDSCDNEAIIGSTKTNCFVIGDCGNTHTGEGSIVYDITGHSGTVTITDMDCTAWDSGTTYVIDDVVTDVGEMYICVLGHTNQQPPNVTYWTKLT